MKLKSIVDGKYFYSQKDLLGELNKYRIGTKIFECNKDILTSEVGQSKLLRNMKTTTGRNCPHCEANGNPVILASFQFTLPTCFTVKRNRFYRVKLFFLQSCCECNKLYLSKREVVTEYDTTNSIYIGNNYRMVDIDEA